MTTPQAHAFNNRNDVIAQAIEDARSTRSKPGKPAERHQRGGSDQGVPYYEYSAEEWGFAGYHIPLCSRPFAGLDVVLSRKENKCQY